MTVCGCCYCEPCWVFADKNSQYFKVNWVSGICQWKTLSQKILKHETSGTHIVACVTHDAWKYNKNLLDQNFEKKITKKAIFFDDKFYTEFWMLH